MARKKHKKITEVRTFPNVFDYKNENVEEELIQFFNSHKNFIAELGCGQADYSINLALNFTEKNFIGIDRKANRIWNASKNATLQNLNNVVFLISYVEKLEEIFRKIKFEKIWITFPDPYPRNGSVKKRLTHPRFLNIYKNLLSPNGKINLKTDDDTLYSYTLKVIKEENLKLHYETNDLYANENLPFEYSIKTKYEKMHLEEGKKIKLISFSF